jgi:U3 small nucleolar RNA-associated protein 14
MNIRCIFVHKWELSKIEREIEYTLPKFGKKGAWNGSGKKVTITTSDDIRICKRCYKKQKAMYSPFSHVKIADWRNDELSKDELRDKKLKELGI